MMATVTKAPLVACDCCGVTAEKSKRHYDSKDWDRPAGWDSLRVPPSYWGTYPNHIVFADVCPECCVKINKAVSDVVDAIHAEQKAKNHD